MENFITLRLYYENLSKRAIISRQRSRIVHQKMSKLDPQYKQLQMLKLKVKNFRKKMLLLRQKRLKKNTYFKLLVGKAASLFPELSLHQIYDAFMGGLRSIVYMPWTLGRWLMHFTFMQKISYYTVQSRILSNFVYLVRVSGLKIKFLWDTLNHYFLLMSLLRLMWQ